jgi:hypothetical protein
VDVADGGGDRIDVQGDLTLSGLALVVDNPASLNPAQDYTIITCTGTRTGTFSSKTLPSGWTVAYEPDGDVVLRYVGGTLFMLR